MTDAINNEPAGLGGQGGLSGELSTTIIAAKCLFFKLLTPDTAAIVAVAAYGLAGRAI